MTRHQLTSLNIICLIFFSFLFISNPASTQPSPLAFTALSDIHFDPFFGCSKPNSCETVKLLQKYPVTAWDLILKNNPKQLQDKLNLGDDSNLYLLNQITLIVRENIKKNNSKFIVITGDFIAHHIKNNYIKYFGTNQGYPTFINKLFTYLHQKITDKIRIPVFFVMGNNDGYNGDYVLNTNNNFFSDINNMWSSLDARNSNNKIINHTNNLIV